MERPIIAKNQFVEYQFIVYCKNKKETEKGHCLIDQYGRLFEYDGERLIPLSRENHIVVSKPSSEKRFVWLVEEQGCVGIVGAFSSEEKANQFVSGLGSKRYHYRVTQKLLDYVPAAAPIAAPLLAGFED